jgi:hypothetical protein
MTPTGNTRPRHARPRHATQREAERSVAKPSEAQAPRPPMWELAECTCPDYCERDHELD